MPDIESLCYGGHQNKQIDGQVPLQRAIAWVRRSAETVLYDNEMARRDGSTNNTRQMDHKNGLPWAEASISAVERVESSVRKRDGGRGSGV